MENVIAPVPRVSVRLSVSVVVVELSETTPLAVAPPPAAALVLNTTVSAEPPLPMVIEVAETEMPAAPVVETLLLIVTAAPEAERLRRRLSRRPVIGAPSSPTNVTLPSPAVTVSE